MSDTPPDRLSSDPRSRFHDAAALERGIGVRFNGEEKTNVEEYCVSEGWVRLPFGQALDRRGNPMTVKVKGTVEPWRSEEHTSELQSLMRISYAVFCLKKKQKTKIITIMNSRQ